MKSKSFWKFAVFFSLIISAEAFAQNRGPDNQAMQQILAELPRLSSILNEQETKQTMSLEEVSIIYREEDTLKDLKFFEGHPDVFQRVKVQLWKEGMSAEGFAGEYSSFFVELQNQKLYAPKYVVEYRVAAEPFQQKYLNKLGFRTRIIDMNTVTGEDKKRKDQKTISAVTKYFLVPIYDLKPKFELETIKKYDEYRGVSLLTILVQNAGVYESRSSTPIISAENAGFAFLREPRIMPDPLWPSKMRVSGATLQTRIGQKKVPGKPWVDLSVKDVLLLEKATRDAYFPGFFEAIYAIRRDGEKNINEQKKTASERRFGERHHGDNELQALPFPKFYHVTSSGDIVEEDIRPELLLLYKFMAIIDAAKKQDDLKSPAGPVDMTKSLNDWYEYMEQLHEEQRQLEEGGGDGTHSVEKHE